MVCIIQLYKFIEKENIKIVDYIFVISFGILMLLLRNNAIYAMIVFVPFVILILFRQRKKLYELLFVICFICIAYIIINNILIIIVQAQKDVSQEKYSVFSQATARIVKENKEELTEEEKEKINFYFNDYEKLGQVYMSNISDNTKNMINCDNVDNNKKDFLEFMIYLLKKYPSQFIVSFLDTTRGYWNIFDNTFNQIEHEKNPMTMGMLELTNYQIYSYTPPIVEQSLIPQLKIICQKLFCGNEYRKIPILFIIFQPATYFYVLIIALIYSLYKKNKKIIIIEIYLFLYFLTCFLGPVALIRYIYVVIVSVPIFSIGIGISKNKKTGEKDETKIK